MSGLADWLTSWLYFYIQVGQVAAAAAAAAVAETELNKKKRRRRSKCFSIFCLSKLTSTVVD